MENFIDVLTNFNFIEEIEKCPKSLRPFLYVQVYEMIKKKKTNRKFKKCR